MAQPVEIVFIMIPESGGHLPQGQIDVEKRSRTGPEPRGQALADAPQTEDRFPKFQIAFGKLFHGHVLREKNRGAMIIVGPVPMEQPALCHHAVEKGGAWIRGQDIGPHRDEIVFHDKLQGAAENGLVLLV